MKKDDVLRFLASVVNVDPIDLLSSGKDTYMVKSVENIPKSVRLCIQTTYKTHGKENINERGKPHKRS